MLVFSRDPSDGVEVFWPGHPPGYPPRTSADIPPKNFMPRLLFLGRPSMEAFFGHPREPLSGY